MTTVTTATATTTSKKHPKQLYLLFFAEMWERFSFYGMSALLIAYMVSQLNFDEPKSYAILGAYSALVYTMPVFGGMIADRILGYRKAILWGGLLMVVGHLVLAIPQGWSFFYGMAFIICGNGFFKPNISSLVGSLYEENDARKDSAFSIFYMGINTGAALGGLICGYVGETINWHLGFGLAGVFMIVGLTTFRFGQKSLGRKGLPPGTRHQKKLLPMLSMERFIYIATLLTIFAVVGLFWVYMIMNWIMMIMGALSLVYIFYIAGKLDRKARFKLFAATVLIIFSILFWAFYYQYSGSLNLFAIRNVNMRFFGIDLPPLSINNFLPPFWVIVLSPVFAWLWIRLQKRGWEPGTPVKFVLGFVFTGIGFGFFYLGCLLNHNGLIPLSTFVLAYFAIECGEVCLSPIGLSMITKLSPSNLVGMMMGLWFFATAAGEFLAAKIGSLMSVPKGTASAVQTLPVYAGIISKIAGGSFIIAILLLCLVPLLKKWMGDIR